jgi:hypothetical protein
MRLPELAAGNGTRGAFAEAILEKEKNEMKLRLTS